MVDILRTLAVEVHCDQCGDFEIGADVIAESQRMLAEGCLGSPHECPPRLYATLLPQGALDSLRRAWDELESVTRSPVREISLEDPPRVAVRPNDKLDPHTLARWEDDGGYVPAVAASA